MNITNDERIEQYLLNKMSENEKSAFQFELMQDRNLREEIKSMRRIQKTLSATNRTKPKSNGSSLDKRWLLILLLPVLYFAVNFFSGGENSPKPVNNETTIAPVLDQEEDQESLIEIPNSESKETEDIQSEENVNPQTEERKLPQKQEKKEKVQIYAANYDINPLIENELNSTLRGDYDVKKIAPQDDAIYEARNGRINFSYEGKLDTEKIPEDDFSLVMEIYSNEIEAFKKNEFIIQRPVKINSDTSPFELSWNAIFDAQAKLYYYLLRDDYSGVILNGGKFRVK